jgi:DNA polymerase I-like protein with 3'-5' exonuclease and polymerase domains
MQAHALIVPLSCLRVNTPRPHQPGKRINFSIVYGAGKRQVAAELGLSQKEAGAIMDK